MESMEDVYLAENVHGDGSNQIKVGEVIAIMVEDEDDIAKLRDYTPSGKGATIDKTPSKEASPPPPPLKEETPSPVVSPKTEKSATSLETEDRIFASPIARKMAEDHKVLISSIRGTGPNGCIVKTNIEDYLEESLKRILSEPSPGVYTFYMFQQGVCELLINEVENIEKLVDARKLTVVRPNTMNQYGVVLDDFGF